MKVIGKYIIIDPVKEGRVKTKSGFELGEKHREDIRYREASVVEIGGEVNGIVPGDRIYYDRHAGFDLEIDGTIYKIIKEFDVVVVL